MYRASVAVDERKGVRKGENKRLFRTTESVEGGFDLV